MKEREAKPATNSSMGPMNPMTASQCRIFALCATHIAVRLHLRCAAHRMPLGPAAIKMERLTPEI